MRRRSLFWHFFPLLLIVVIASLLVAVIYTSQVFRESYFRQVRTDLLSSARLIEQIFAHKLAPERVSETDSLCKHLGRSAGTRITIMAPNGVVLCDSDEDPANMENHADRPEMREALRGETGQSRRYSVTLGKDMMYVAVGNIVDGRIEAVIRTSKPLGMLEEKFGQVVGRMILGLVALLLVSGSVSYVSSRRITMPVQKLRHWAENLARGQFEHRLSLPEPTEIAGLTQALNSMADQLEERIQVITRQRNEQRAILESMVEGVLAVDADEHIINLNASAARMLGIDEEQARGKWVQEAIRNSDIERFIRTTLERKLPAEAEVMLLDIHGSERHLQAHGTVLSDDHGESLGALIVLNDVTRLKRLERIRRDFVANVSHELRTPLTSIKGAIETIQTAALNDRAQAERFLDIALNHVNRLNAIVDDLLTLSRIEKEAEEQEIPLESSRIRDVLTAAGGIIEQKAARKNITVDIACDEALSADINRMLIEQAVINLLDNAVKYSEPGTTVDVSARADNGSVAITVRDHGPGISKEHQERLFERFYRVDKARSRKLGGTGLGLAIVKHIAVAHKGSITVESKVGRESTFTLSIPAGPDALAGPPLS